MAQNFAAFQSGAADVVWRLVDRNLQAGYSAHDLVALGISTKWAAVANRETGNFEACHSLLDDACAEIESRIEDASNELLAVYGALQAERSSVYARAGESGFALRHLDRAEEAGQRLPEDFFYSPVSFGRSEVAVQMTMLECDLRRPGAALRAARRAARHRVPSRPRWGRHHIDRARAHFLRNDHQATLEALRDAHQVSPQSLIFNAHARQLAMDLAETRGQHMIAHEAAVLTGLSKH